MPLRHSRPAVTNVNPFLLADLAPDMATEEGRPDVRGTTPPVQEAQQKSAKAAVLADSFCVLAKLVARHKPRQQACAQMLHSQHLQTSQHTTIYNDLQMVQSLKQLQSPLLQSDIATADLSQTSLTKTLPLLQANCGTGHLRMRT